MEKGLTCLYVKKKTHTREHATTLSIPLYKQLDLQKKNPIISTSSISSVYVHAYFFSLVFLGAAVDGARA